MPHIRLAIKISSLHCLAPPLAHHAPQECVALELPPPALPELDAAASDFAAARAGWARYAEFLSERGALANRDWLSMRDQVRRLGCSGAF